MRRSLLLFCQLNIFSIFFLINISSIISSLILICYFASSSFLFFNHIKSPSFFLHSSPSSSKLLSMASYGGELFLDSSSPWSGISSLSSFSIILPFIFQEATESIDEEDPRPTTSNGAYITMGQGWVHLSLYKLD